MIETENDQQNFDDHLRCRLQSLHYEIYPPRWTFAQKNEIKPLLGAFMKQYPLVFEDVGVQKILDNLLERKARCNIDFILHLYKYAFRHLAGNSPSI